MAKNKYTDLDDTEATDKWKKKYLASLEDLDIKEKQWADSEKNLRALIIQLTKAADRSSEKLNVQLGVLRDALNKGVAANKLKKAIDEVADSILGLDALRQRKRNELKNSFSDLIKKIYPAGKIEKKLRKLSTKLDKTTSSKEISPLINDLANLLVDGLSITENKKEQGFISSLLSKKEKSDENIIVSSKEREIQPAESSDYEIKVSKAQQSLVALLEKMILPADLQTEANLVKRALNQQVNEKVLLESLEQTVAITSNILQRVKKEKNEIEAFLKQLTGRLQELDRDIRETARIKELSHLNGKEMTDGLKQEMQTMEDGINNIKNLDELKTAIQSRVILLRNHVDTFIIKEDEKQNEANAVIEQLKSQVKVMEAETEVLKQQIEEERKQTLRDVLTEIPNRLAYEERLELELANFRRNKSPFTLVVWDIDFFKKVNDQYGHSAGDQVLKLVSSILNKNMRETDFIARFGGEEFVSILPATDITSAQLITDKLREIIATSNFHFREEAVKVTVSAGFATVKENENGDDLFVRADKALYKAKENGRNNCQPAN